MRYGDVSVGSAYIPKLLGIYERELADLIEDACKRDPALIVDVGAAEGYYAIGLALRNPAARVVAFEDDSRGRDALRHTAALNGVSARLEIRGRCEPADLVAALEGAPEVLVICDVEGFEETLLDPSLVPALSRATILVELHEFLVPGVTALLGERFHDTHVLQHVLQKSRSSDDFPWRTLFTAVLPSSYLAWAVSEWRPERMSWLWMVPR